MEEALLYSGQFKDAMSALLEWLKKQQKELSGDSPVHGDLDTVMALIEQHKVCSIKDNTKRHWLYDGTSSVLRKMHRVVRVCQGSKLCRRTEGKFETIPSGQRGIVDYNLFF